MLAIHAEYVAWAGISPGEWEGRTGAFHGAGLARFVRNELAGDIVPPKVFSDRRALWRSGESIDITSLG